MDFIAAETINAATADYMHFVPLLPLSPLTSESDSICECRNYASSMSDECQSILFM